MFRLSWRHACADVIRADGTALGNHPQTYSHTGLIENACSLDAAR